MSNQTQQNSALVESKKIYEEICNQYNASKKSHKVLDSSLNSESSLRLLNFHTFNIDAGKRKRRSLAEIAFLNRCNNFSKYANAELLNETAMFLFN